MKSLMYRRLVGAVACLLLAAGCSAESQSSAKGAVATVNDACIRVREANRQLEELQLDQKGEDFINDPRVNAALKESAEATKNLATQVDAAAKQDQGRVGRIRNAIEDNKTLIKKIGTYVAAETIDDARDKARQMRALADIVGADACASPA